MASPRSVRPQSPVTSWLPWTPGTGDLIRVRVTDPVASSGPVEHWPAVVVSPATYSARTRSALVCAVVSDFRGYPFEVAMPPGFPVGGAILADRILSLDTRRHPVGLVATLPLEVIVAVRQRLLPLIAPEAILGPSRMDQREAR